MNIRRLENKLIRIEQTAKGTLSRAFEAEVGEVAKATLAFSHIQFKSRPRIRLLAKIMPVLALAFLASSTVVGYIKPREAQIKINGQAIIVANTNPEAQKPPAVEIVQQVGFKRSPFEFEMPVDNGYVSQGFRSYHRAHDIATSFGLPIHPVGSGVVEYAGFTSDGKGNIVVVDHGDSLKSLYAHMGKIHVGVGNVVSVNSTLGTVGMTGHTTGPHVHLEIYDRDVAVDPGNLLPESTN